MNVNRRIILVSKIGYDKIDDYGKLCAFYLITDTDLCERCSLHDFTYLTGFYRLSGTTFVRKVCMKFEYVCKPVFVNTICLLKPHTFMWQNLDDRDLWLALQISIFLCYYLAKSDWVFTEL